MSVFRDIMFILVHGDGRKAKLLQEVSALEESSSELLFLLFLLA